MYSLHLFLLLHLLFDLQPRTLIVILLKTFLQYMFCKNAKTNETVDKGNYAIIM